MTMNMTMTMNMNRATDMDMATATDTAMLTKKREQHHRSRPHLLCRWPNSPLIRVDCHISMKRV